MHWTHKQSTLFQVVALRKVNNCVWEDYFVFIKDDLKHDVPFVKICNSIIIKYYADINIPVLTGTEFNDGCSSQFKGIAAFTQYTCRSVPTTRIFFETSHGKSKADEPGEVVKCFATHEVNAREVIIRNASELFEFCLEKPTIKESPDDKKALLNRVFYFIPSHIVHDYDRQLPVLK